MKWLARITPYLILLAPTLGWSESPINLTNTKSYRNDQGFVVELTFQQAVSDRDFKFDFINRTIQVDIPTATFEGQKAHARVNDSEVSSIFVYQLANDILRCRINLRPSFTSLQYKSRVSAANFDKTIRIEIKGQRPATLLASSESAGSELPPPKSLNQEAEQAFDLSEESAPIEDGSIAPSDASLSGPPAETTIPSPRPAKKESEIPVLTKATTSQSALSMRYLVSAALLICALLVGSYFLLREYRHRLRIKNKQTQIKIITQHYLGPKKSLAIIRVAGESILIGITDHNINLIKALSLLDDELPAIDQSSFAKTMSDVVAPDGADAQSNLDDFAVKEIREIVNHRLKGLREI